ncbi:MAG TPA: type II toxin-antitoxin system HicB family antitoxin [Chitinophagales bacterium]|nr:type II toxin-antitoxin system HicB family antitoxin [Chitinophagales bacterium]
MVVEKPKTDYSAYVPDLPGCIATGKTKEQVQNNIESAIEFHLEGMKESKQGIPNQNAEAMNILVPVH